MKFVFFKLLCISIIASVIIMSANAQTPTIPKRKKFGQRFNEQLLRNFSRIPQNNSKESLQKNMPCIRWQKCIGGSNDDYAFTVIKLSDGNYLTCGATSSQDGQFHAVHGNYDAFLLKTDKNGKIIWQKTYGGTQDEAFQDIREKSNGDIIAIGWTNSNDGQVSGNHSHDGLNDAWLIETSSTGKLLWQHCYGGSGDDYGVRLTNSNENNIVFCGVTSSIDGDISKNHGDYDGWLVKLKTSGFIDFSVTIGDTAYDDFVDVAEIKGNYLAIGTTSKETGDSAELHSDAHAALFDKSGKIIFYRKYGGTGSDAGNALIPATDGNAVLTGHTASSDGDVNTNSGFNMWVWKIDLANKGSIIWQNYFGVPREIAAAYNVIATKDKGFVLVGGIAPDLFDPFGVEDAFAAKVNAEGRGLWTKRFGGSNAEFLNGGVEEEDGSILVSGATGSNDGDVIGNHGGPEDVWLVKLDQCEDDDLGVDNTPVLKKDLMPDSIAGKISLANFPNPLSNSTTISFSLDQPQKVSICIFEMNGRLVKILADAQMQAGTHQLTWSAKGEKGNTVSAGIYFLRMQTGNYVETRKLVVVK
jgi:hypothetical protein